MMIFVIAPFVYGRHAVNPLVSLLYNSFDYLSKKIGFI